ncbi:MAG: Bacterial antitoxin of ParD toxin-antitoxin type system, partial [Humisphaera sp.]|nr:Bacterial antitoxin of ParD toxin-antitoxin type system [Humisphaera sp.]
MNIELDPEAQRFIAKKVSSGAYPSASAAVNDLLAGARAQEEWTAEDVAELRAMIAIGVEQAARGESKPWDAEALKRRLHE